jgi:hypothetical protein
MDYSYHEAQRLEHETLTLLKQIIGKLKIDGDIAPLQEIRDLVYRHLFGKGSI